MLESAESRPVLSAAGLARALAAADVEWPVAGVLRSTGSTNADLLQRSGELPSGAILAADEQTAGRGRLGRDWSSPTGASVSVSVLVRPRPPGHTWGWLPLLTGLAVAQGITAATGVSASLKWPNDVLLGAPAPGKTAGILVEREGDAAVLGFGINTAMEVGELPVPEASSLALAGAAVDPDELVAACLAALRSWCGRWEAADGDADRSGLRDAYRSACSTLGSEVAVSLPGGGALAGSATDVDGSGRLLVDSGAGPVPVAAGDVRHVRPAE